MSNLRIQYRVKKASARKSRIPFIPIAQSYNIPTLMSDNDDNNTQNAKSYNSYIITCMCG